MKVPVIPVPAAPVASGAPLLPRTAARLVGFLALGLFGAVRWADIVVPGRGTALAVCVVLAAALGLGAGSIARLGVWQRRAALAGLLVAVPIGAVIAVGVPLALLSPLRWAELGDGIAQGLETVAGVRVPYRSGDPWVEYLLLVGAPALLGLAAALTWLPRRSGALGFPTLAAAALAAIFAIAAIQVPPQRPMLDGAVFAALLVLFLTFERVPRTAWGPAAALAACSLALAALVAPTLNADEPLLDYEAIAQSLAPEDASRFSWSHRYGPLDWPRDGSEVLRVRAQRSAYWKATTLSDFDGLRWTRGADTDPGIGTEIDRSQPDWTQRLRVTVREMTSEEFIGAGTILSIARSPRDPVTSAPGEFRTRSRPLRPGHTYEAEVYTPRPDAQELTASGTEYPPFVYDELGMDLPAAVGGPATRRGSSVTNIRFPAFGSLDSTTATVDGALVMGDEAEQLVADSAYGRAYALAQELRADADTPYGFIRAVQRRLRTGFTYTESPPRRPVPLDAFLFVDRRGYCQQFSGAMALLLRMGGIPTRVASGFSPGELDRKRREYVVRDVDAHSWVEVYIPGAGWVPFDPTPSAAPARARVIGPAPASAASDPGPTSAGSERGLDAAPLGGDAAEPVASSGRGARGLIIAVVGTVLAAGLLAAALRTRRRRRRHARAPIPEAVADLERALVRTGFPVAPGTTLSVLGERFAGTRGEAYIRMLLAARFSRGARPPGRRERAGLRDALARGGSSPVARVRAWWALPPL